MKIILEASGLPCSQRTFFFLVIFGIMTVMHLFNITTHIHNSRWNVSFWSVLRNRSGIYGSVTETNKGHIDLPECKAMPAGLQGRVVVKTNITDWTHIEKDIKNINSGGRYKPQNCIARHRVAIVIPYRDRENNLKVLLQHLHPILQRHQIDYGIYVVEMPPGGQFNKAFLMNVAFVEASKQYDYHCFIFHDVDMIPEDDRNLYTCPSMPRHMATAVSKFKYKLPYSTYFGGVVAIQTHHFRLINGFSNLYFDWGAEDDDFYMRVVHSNLTVIRYSDKYGRYKKLAHKESPRNPNRGKLVQKAKQRQASDGLSSLKYFLITIEKKPLFTWILVSMNISEPMKQS